MSKKSVLIVFPDNRGVDVITNYFAPCLGVVRLVSFLKKHNHNAEYFDNNLYYLNGKGPSLKEKFSEKKWDYIGFSTLDDTLLLDIENMYLANKICPTAVIVAGGIEAQFNYQTILDKSPCRIVITGEGELPFKMLADDEPWQNIPGLIMKNIAHPLSQEVFNEATSAIEWEKLPYEDYWDCYKKVYDGEWDELTERQVQTVRVFARNRCPIGCKFCSSTNQLTWGSGKNVPVISGTEENLISIIDRIVKSHPDVKQIYFTDDDFMINRQAVIRFCKLVVDRKYNDLSFMSFSRITDLNENVLTWLKKANWRMLNIGVENFSNKVLEEMGKRCDADRIEPILDLIIKHGIRAHITLILATPECNLEDIELTLTKALKYFKLDEVQGSINPGVFPLKGSEFYELNTNFKSRVIQIPNTEHFIKKDDLIFANDPQVREFQKRYIQNIDGRLNKFITENKIKHPSSAKLVLERCKFALDILREVKNNESLEQADSNSEMFVEDNNREFSQYSLDANVGNKHSTDSGLQRPVAKGYLAPAQIEIAKRLRKRYKESNIDFTETSKDLPIK